MEQLVFIVIVGGYCTIAVTYIAFVLCRSLYKHIRRYKECKRRRREYYDYQQLKQVLHDFYGLDRENTTTTKNKEEKTHENH